MGGNPRRVPAIYAIFAHVRGGTGALVDGFVRKLKSGGRSSIAPKWRRSRREGWFLAAKGNRRGARRWAGSRGRYYLPNADYAHTYKDLIERQHRRKHSDASIRRKRYSMSLVVYFGFKQGERPLDPKHHNIILSPLRGIARRHFRSKDFGGGFRQYLHLPTLTDPSMVPDAIMQRTPHTRPNLKGK